MNKVLLIGLLLLSFFGYSQKKTLKTIFISEKIEIDGKLDESIWQSAPIATDFIMFEPDNGKVMPNNKKTEVRVLYDNDAIYIGALLNDDKPDKILTEITQRDEFGTADLFGVFINGYNDGQQDFQFFVNAADGQADCITTDANGEDYSWDAVWRSKAVITDKGWVVEMRIPYAAIRFSNESKQTWGINFFREIRRDRQKYTWNFIDSKLGTFTQQSGTLEGIANIKTPTRLFLLPYSSFYATANATQKTYGTLKGGLDLKYGINDAFTLDMILIPDFGQTKYDDQILNLGPFEQQFNENRAFFTEGTDLFSKGDLLYSRRIGGSPSVKTNKIAITINEEVEEYPVNVNLVNALKVTGRTKNGLGIGILNAVTEKTTATVRNKVTQNSRRIVVEPLANYNVLVLDQRFGKNSSIAFVNTNVTRNGGFRDGNATALVWDLNTKKNTYSLTGDFKYSYVNAEKDKKGVNSQLNFSETSGKFRYGIGADIITKEYDNNDLGINFETNYFSFYGNTSYRILNPTKYFNSFNARINAYSQFQKETGKLQSGNINIQINSKDKKNIYYGLGIDANPIQTFDYYEPQTMGRYVLLPSKISGFIYVSTNYNKSFAIDFNPSFTAFDEEKRNSYGFEIGPRYRFSDKLSLIYTFNFLRQNNNKGYIDSIKEDLNPETPNLIIFANRNVITYSNALSGKYAVNSKMSFNLSVRHYWSYAENKNILSLQENGSLANYTQYSSNKNSSFYSWNADLSYSWWFAPGSQLSLLYRNNAGSFESNINKDFQNNVTKLLTNDALNHVLSISVRYFIDYNQIKNKF
ncbi:hypothetical protein RCH18_003224 [Flavobacterium sp. PL11]|jgi:hypothetical protein|uniref:DUF5916 domain-containing protein n=1 Tax=Flavobacterium sp. PL11 TaxID=3071717 RepID=UPI002E069A9E|nr:hypothetical protein [Flavobacterium sp. PL11]